MGIEGVRRCEMRVGRVRCPNEAVKQINIGAAVGKMWVCKECGSGLEEI